MRQVRISLAARYLRGRQRVRASHVANRGRTICILAVFVVVVIVSTRSPASAQTINLGPGTGAFNMGLRADVNDAGTVVVTTRNSSSVLGGFIRWNDANGTTAQFPQGYAPYSIDNSGTVAGIYYGATAADNRVFRWSDADHNFSIGTGELTLSQIGTQSYPFEVNESSSGIVVGTSEYFTTSSGRVWPAWSLNNGTINAIRYPDSVLGTKDYTIATGVNATGTVVGTAFNEVGPVTAFKWSAPNTFTPLTYSSGVYGTLTALKINDAGQVSGSALYYDTSLGRENSHAMLWSAANNPTDLNPPGAITSKTHGLNNLGQVIGSATQSNGTTYGFLWDSVHGYQNLSTFAGTAVQQPIAISDTGYVVASTGSNLALKQA